MDRLLIFRKNKAFKINEIHPRTVQEELMRKIYLFLASVMLVAFFCQITLAEPFAPMAKLNGKGLKMQKLSGETEADRLQKVPSIEEVGVPPYPGAVIISIIIDESGQMMPGLNLVSTDPPEKVRAWYKENLQGWRWSEMLELFYQGEGELKNLAQVMTTPTINALPLSSEAIDMRFSDVPGAQTRIQITYQPKSN